MATLDETELNVGGVKLRGVWLAMGFTLVSSIAGVIWTASSLYGRLETLESDQIPDDRIVKIETAMSENDVSGLGAKLAQLVTNLDQILKSQGELLEIRDEVQDLKTQIEGMKATVQAAQLITEKTDDFGNRVDAFENRFDKQDREADDLWKAIDDLSSNPLGH